MQTPGWGSRRPERRLPCCGLVAVVALLAATPGRGVSAPDPAQCDIGRGVALCGTWQGAVDQACRTRIVIRDSQRRPIPNSVVLIYFTACANAGEMRLCGLQPFPGTGWRCSDKLIALLTDASGIATPDLVGHAVNPGGGKPGSPAPGVRTPCATVYADGVYLGTLPFAAYDQNGYNGVDENDLALFLNDRFSITGPADMRIRSDFNFDGAVNAADLALILRVRYANKSSNSCYQVCP